MFKLQKIGEEKIKKWEKTNKSLDGDLKHKHIKKYIKWK